MIQNFWLWFRTLIMKDMSEFTVDETKKQETYENVMKEEEV